MHGRFAHRDIDDAAAPRGQHPGCDLARHQEIPGQVGLDHRTEGVDRHLPEALRVRHEPRVDRAHADPRVVHQHLDPAEPRPRLVDRPDHRGLVSHIKLDADRSRQVRGDRARVLTGPAGQRDRRSCLG